MTAQARDACVDTLVAGAKLANEVLDLQLPVPVFRHWDRAIVREAACEEPHNMALQLCGAMFDVPVDPHDWQALLDRYASILGRSEGIEAAFPKAVEAADADEPALLRLVAGLFEVRELQTAAVAGLPRFTSVKINHVHWEYIASRALRSVGRQYHRQLDEQALALFERARFDAFLVGCLRVVARNLRSGSEPGFHGASFSLGISFNNGDGRLADDLAVPILPVMRGAMIGACGFFGGIFGAGPHHVSDGAFAKMLVWRCELDLLVSMLLASADVVVVIAPGPLRSIRFRSWDGPLEVIPVPLHTVHELWPAVIALVTGRLAEIARGHRRIAILAQAGLMSVPIGIAVHALAPCFPEAEIRYFDLGQALDAAGYPGSSIGPWMRQPELQDALARAAPFPFYLHG